VAIVTKNKTNHERKETMKKYILAIVAGLIAVCSNYTAQAAVVTVDGGVITNGFMNVKELNDDFVYNSSWGVADLRASFSNGGSTVTLKANNIGDPNPFWYIGGGALGNPGNKKMEANLYAENTGGLLNQTLTFSGVVDSYTLASGYRVKAFIKDFAADYGSYNIVETVLSSVGTFEISYLNGGNAARHLQWGFQTYGPNAWGTDADAMGSVVISASAIPEPSVASLLGFGVLGLAATRFRRRS
jgi:hypothetical protein